MIKQLGGDSVVMCCCAVIVNRRKRVSPRSETEGRKLNSFKHHPKLFCTTPLPFIFRILIRTSWRRFQIAFELPSGRTEHPCRRDIVPRVNRDESHKLRTNIYCNSRVAFYRQFIYDFGSQCITDSGALAESF
jgi:hypothetical protein